MFQHTQVINEYADETFKLVLTNNSYIGKLLPEMEWVRTGADKCHGWEIIAGDLADETSPWRHDSEKLAKALMALLNERPIMAIL